MAMAAILNLEVKMVPNLKNNNLVKFFTPQNPELDIICIFIS